MPMTIVRPCPPPSRAGPARPPSPPVTTPPASWSWSTSRPPAGSSAWAISKCSPAARTLVTCLVVIPHVIGRSATDVEDLAPALAGNYWVGQMGVTVMAQSAIDIALWDASASMRACRSTGSWGITQRRSRPMAPAAGAGLAPTAWSKARRYVEQGFTAIKMQAGHLWDGLDAANVAQMREALGPADIMIDVNMGWTADEAIQIGRRFEEHDVYWVEEPVVCEDFAGYLGSRALDKIVGGETHFTRFDARFAENPRLPILQPDVMQGGFTELRKIAALADTWGMTLAPHLSPN